MKANVMVTTGGTSLKDDIMRLDEPGESSFRREMIVLSHKCASDSLVRVGPPFLVSH